MLLVALAGCGEDQLPTSPAEPESDLAVAAATQAVSFRQVSAGLEHTCGVTTTNQAYCWGKNYSGELGNGSSGWGVTETRPVPVSGGHQFRHVSVGYDHSCGITTEFRAYCWGGNYSAQLGDGTTTDRSTPVAVAGGFQFSQIDAGHFAHTCAVNQLTKRVYCWGNNLKGQLGDGTTDWHKTPTPIASGRQFRQVSAGADHTCGVTTANQAYCWGDNDLGQVGDNTDARRRARPTLVAGGRSYRQLDAGNYHNCAVTSGNKAFCWGSGSQGQIGDGRTIQRFSPRAVAGGLLFERVSAGGWHSCAETPENRVYCWGRNAEGQLGDGTTSQRLTPVRVAGSRSFAQVSGGNAHTCGVTPSNAAYCWGANGHGELGDGTKTNRSRPTAVAAPM
jgi:alpha-tubulin suppressor-like RCC1 family protein